MREPDQETDHKTDQEPLIQQLLTVAQAFAGARGISLSRVSTLAFNDGGKFKALQNGADIGARRLTVALQWFSDNWPDGAGWPDGVDRPRPLEVNTGTPQVGSFQ